jgi:quercetin dioxygenase-like cupin family protein
MNIATTTIQDQRSGAAIVIAQREDLTWFDTIEGERSTLHVSSEQSGGAFGIMESIIAPYAASPRHYHREDEVFFIIEGLATIEIAGAIHHAGPGTTILAPAGVPHAWKNPTGSPLRLLATFTPGGIEGMFQQFAGKRMQEIVEIAESYGTYVVSPPVA